MIITAGVGTLAAPDVKAKGIQSGNLTLTFDEALRLSTAIQSCILKLNRYSRSTKSGKAMGLCLSIKTEPSAISVIETPVREAKIVAHVDEHVF